MSPDHLLLPMEVAALFKVDPKTVTRWALSGRLTSIRTIGGHRRYRWGDVQEALASVTVELDPKRDGNECSDARGTVKGYHRHKSRGDEPCDLCRKAKTLADRLKYGGSGAVR